MKVSQWAYTGLAFMISSGCVTEHNTVPHQTTTLKPAGNSASQTELSPTQQAKLDAKIAVEQGNFKLLAFTNRVINFPGIDMNLYPLEVIEQQCGVKYLAGSGDTLKLGESTEARKALKKYATTYNLIVLKACQSFHKNNQK
ncbi:hypothetical protein Q4574_02235 [Aliiglaciecola sp. 3_MG-2023]|uniref:hypothetical protein n=1 Tax=Aliiglaciecola sp. 3_MG-2023 TaxID=3062644 RepID=UPI0026E370D2|nr:hypothetical protein [Aliiglaciecola sp. 3_MG-2023]MDO6692080.1 hypothetical protein [Aliiglaciecola sp. 3_MG-2023]